MAKVRQPFYWMTAFAIAMALLEAAVVVYLRAIYYPDGFQFPLVPIDPTISWVEVTREFATMIMLLAAGALLTKSALERFAWFAFNFGIWDIFYYMFLKVFLDWPESFFTWDVLFLIPVIWVGPVLAPCIVSIGLITMATIILQHRVTYPAFRVRKAEWMLMSTGALVIMFTFMQDHLRVLAGMDRASSSWQDLLWTSLASYVPTAFNWPLFIVGCLSAGLGMGRMARRLGA